MTAPTKEAPAAKPEKERSRRNPFQDYVVRAPSKEYSGYTAKFEFMRGRTEVHALARDTCKCDTPMVKGVRVHLDDCKVGERIDALDYFLNAGYAVKFAKFLVEEEDDDDDDDE